MKDMEADVVRSSILKLVCVLMVGHKTARPIVAEVGLCRAHMIISLHVETQALVVSTLGTGQDEQIIDALTGKVERALCCNSYFPPVLLVKLDVWDRPGRREVGHGKLAWRSINPLLPSKDEFPYTIRIVSEITESNGSSSMATVCGTSLALMDAGVPLARPVAGIAMGLIKEGDDYAVLSDILGDEDHLGDMDFKVAGTDTGLQLCRWISRLHPSHRKLCRLR